MTRLFRSKSRDIVDDGFGAIPVNYPSDRHYDGGEEDEEDDDEDYEWEDESFKSPDATPFISPATRSNQNQNNGSGQYSVLTVLVAALRKSLVTCSVESEDLDAPEISHPTNVQHVSHVTFDRFNGFLGLPAELQPEVPKRVPSASASVFGVSAQSMQCSYDKRGNSVPTILLMMQKRLYLEGGLQAEGIFRITAENSQEQFVRSQLNKGVVPPGIDVHCLAGLIKAWLRELPTGVLDSLTPEQVMHCNSEEECARLMKLLPPTEAAILDWAINLMADVVSYEHDNKMNARNIAMVFAPNMTQMADPLTALIHAVQVMNFLKTLIEKTLRGREEASAAAVLLSPCSNSFTNTEETHQTCTQPSDPARNFLLSATLDKLESHSEEKFWSFKENDKIDEVTSTSDPFAPKGENADNKRRGDRLNNSEGESILDRLSFGRGVKKLCCHRVFQLSRTLRRGGAGAEIVNGGRSGREESCA
ncbi:hypothetical protein QQ045_029371 [Rhodiola kirilowii]